MLLAPVRFTRCKHKECSQAAAVRQAATRSRLGGLCNALQVGNAIMLEDASMSACSASNDADTMTWVTAAVRRGLDDRARLGESEIGLSSVDPGRRDSDSQSAHDC